MATNPKQYQRDYMRRKRLASAGPEDQLFHRTRVILKANLREYGPRLAKLLDKWEVEQA